METCFCLSGWGWRHRMYGSRSRMGVMHMLYWFETPETLGLGGRHPAFVQSFPEIDDQIESQLSL